MCQLRVDLTITSVIDTEPSISMANLLVEEAINQYWSITNDSRPSAIADCLTHDGLLDHDKFRELNDKQEELEQADLNLMNAIVFTEEEDVDGDDTTAPSSHESSRSSRSR